MTDATINNAPHAFVRTETLQQQAAPLSVAGPVAWVRNNLFSSPLNTALTLICLYVVVTSVPDLVRFYFTDAVWSGTNRDACLADKVGRPVGACWAYVADRFQYFIYGSYPVSQRWRVNIVFLMFALAVVWMLWDRAPLKKLGAFFFFVVMPLGAYVLLVGGAGAEGVLRTVIMITLALAALYLVLSFVPGLARFWTPAPLLEVEMAATPLQRFQSPKRLILLSLVVFGLIAVLADTAGLPRADTGLWGGIMVTFLIAAVGIVFSLPLGVMLALGRRSRLPIIQLLSVIFIEFVRGVPLITVLFMANTMLPLFVPQEWSPDRLLRPLIGVALFAAAYMAEVIRGGLQAIPKGQYEGAMSLGLGYWQMMRLIILPQALRIVIPGIVNTFIGLFKDTTLVTVVGIFDFLRTIEATLVDPTWATPTTRATGYAFAAVFYFLCCWGMSRYSIAVEKRLAAGQKR
ncbi:MAG: amino acid ABC transporter permease [Bosea sp. (in: a-proteobacteria)]|uniref:amino acid ABC transporter permease n=1 Tax=Bosea sp. (in: a-proteobacteria) TaxID=1871050 RepID=UPI00273581A5|nr:amino acid ABC transporter permease [Bosea sp. (in: a-proteobacteria)]MDP3603307.1 amino acid ABC transporter permease [Bosea sp. (in: a-proteobacteria)]